MSQNEDKNEGLKFHEIETKYRVESEKLHPFKALVEGLDGMDAFLYVQGPDVYYTKGDDEFIRYRKADHGEDDRSELTVKIKTVEKNNIFRKEVNVRVDKNTPETIAEFASSLGFEYNFSIWKACHIYRFEDATLVFYSVRDEDKGSMAHFIEIEVDEETEYTESEAWDIIKKYEAILAPLGIEHRKRLRKSLFEMYRKDSTLESGKD